MWGTGTPKREVMYVDDVAEACLFLMKNYDSSNIVNIGTGKDKTIKEIVGLIKNIVGFKGKIVWDNTKPDGQPRRRLDVSKAKKEFGFVAKTDFKEGLKKTIIWYKKWMK